MITQVIQLLPLTLLTLLAFWRPTWLKGILFLLAGSDALVVGLTWRQAFPTAAGLGTSVVLIGFWLVNMVFFIKVLIARKQPGDDVEEADD